MLAPKHRKKKHHHLSSAKPEPPVSPHLLFSKKNNHLQCAHPKDVEGWSIISVAWFKKTKELLLVALDVTFCSVSALVKSPWRSINLIVWGRGKHFDLESPWNKWPHVETRSWVMTKVLERSTRPSFRKVRKWRGLKLDLRTAVRTRRKAYAYHLASCRCANRGKRKTASQRQTSELNWGDSRQRCNQILPRAWLCFLKTMAVSSACKLPWLDYFACT